MSTETAIVINVILDLAALAPIVLGARWAVATGAPRHPARRGQLQAHRTPAMDRYAD
jgi:hypothetical protein